MNDTLAAKLACTEFKSEAKLAHVLCFWKPMTEVKCLNVQDWKYEEDSKYTIINIKIKSKFKKFLI